MVRMNLVNIHITNAHTTMHSEQGRFQKTGHDGDRQAKLTIERKPGEFRMERTPGKLELNTDEVLDSVRPIKWDTITKEISSKGRDAAMEAIAQYAHMAIDFRDPDVNAIDKEARQKILEDGQKEFGLTWLPSVQAESEYTPEKNKVYNTKDEISINVQKGREPFKFRPGEVEHRFRNRARVDFEYTGGFNRFPTGKHIDTRA